VVAFMDDRFTRPNPIRPDVVLVTDGVMDDLARMIHRHESQVYEWLPYNWQVGSPPGPDDDEGRREWLWRTIIEPRWAARADRFRNYQKGEHRFAEVFEISEYAGDPGADGIQRLFPPFEVS